MQTVIESSPLPEDTCIFEYRSEYTDVERKCMKPRNDDKHMYNEAFCPHTPHGECHPFVMGGRPPNKVKCLSDLWD